MARKIRIEPYSGPVGGWGSVASLARHMARDGAIVRTLPVLAKQNKPGGIACVSCAWAKPAEPHIAEFCENGAKATLWELTDRRATPDFFAEHPLRSLLEWSDHDLEARGRLTHPMRYDPATDRYRPVAWEEAFAEIGRELGRLEPDRVVFYASGRASLETSYMYQLFARLYGTNNLPDSSNMCHETTSVALPESIGSSVGTVTLEDFEETDCILFFGQNTGTNSPRMLHPLQGASRRGIPIITFNPLRERGLERFLNPQEPLHMIANVQTPLSSQYHQVRAGGDLAAIMGLCKALIEADDRASGAGDRPVLDHAFIAEHTHGFEPFARQVRSTGWDELCRLSGLTRDALESAAATYARSDRSMAIFGMGLTQHRLGVRTIQMLINLLLLRGNIGKAGAGILPVRGHSNVQGQRTVGIADRPELVPLDRLAGQYGFEPPRRKGLNTVEACHGILDGSVRGFIGLGGNFVRAAPETRLLEEGWRKLRLNVQVATKLNRSHLVTGEVTYLLPCLGRLEEDRQATGPQAVSTEDSTACIHGSLGIHRPASEHLLSEPRIVAGLARATLPPNPRVDWDGWVADYSRIRDAIEETYPDDFRDFNARLWKPGGFPRPIPARDRKWETDSGRANFLCPEALSPDDGAGGEQAEVLRLITLRSNDQFNTTVYGYRDRLRGVYGTRMVVFVNPSDLVRLGIADGDSVDIRTEVDDGVERRMSGFRVISYPVAEGCCAAYYPECNPLVPLWHHADRSMVPAAKAVPVRLLRAG